MFYINGRRKQLFLLRGNRSPRLRFGHQRNRRLIAAENLHSQQMANCWSSAAAILRCRLRTLEKRGQGRFTHQTKMVELLGVGSLARFVRLVIVLCTAWPRCCKDINRGFRRAERRRFRDWEGVIPCFRFYTRGRLLSRSFAPPPRRLESKAFWWVLSSWPPRSNRPGDRR